jgi:hypothetical protein
MAETSTDLIRQEIDETRADLDARIGRLAAKAERAVDVRNYLSTRPWATVATAVATGVALGLGPRRGAALDGASAGGPAPNGGSFIFRFVARALAGAATMTVAGLLRDAILHEVRAWGSDLDADEPRAR